MMVEGLIAKALADGASDIHLVRGLSPRYRVDGSIREMDPVPLAEEDCSALARELAGADFRKADVVGEADLAVTIAGVRCRVNLFRQQGSLVRRHPPAEGDHSGAGAAGAAAGGGGVCHL